MAKNPDGSTRYNPDGSVYITPVPPVTLNLDAHGNSLDPNTFVHYQSDPDFGTPIQAKAGGTYVVMGQRPSPPDMTPIVCDFGALPSNSGSSSSSSNAHPMSAEFIEDTYDPELGYERYDSPGDNPYISNFTPKQFGYMNDLSTLSPDDLGYYEGTVKGIDDRIISPENPYSLLDQYIFNIKEEVNKTPKTKISTIGRESDDESDELYGQSYEGNPYDRYRRAITN